MRAATATILAAVVSLGLTGIANAADVAALTVTVGTREGQSRLVGIAGAAVFVVGQDPEASIAKAGFKPSPGHTALSRWMDACYSAQKACEPGFRAMTAGAIRSGKTSQSGRLQLRAIPPGRYYVIVRGSDGDVVTFWRAPVDLRAGEVRLTFDQTNGSHIKF